MNFKVTILLSLKVAVFESVQVVEVTTIEKIGGIGVFILI